MTEREYGEDIVEAHWPYDGPHDDWTVSSAGAAVSQLVRYMNNATQPGIAERTLPYARNVDQLLGSLAGAVYGLGQLFDQLRDATLAHAEDTSLYDDRRDRPGRDTALLLTDDLLAIRKRVGMLAASIDAARKHSNHLGHS